jgi:hypothetical protein
MQYKVSETLYIDLKSHVCDTRNIKTEINIRSPLRQRFSNCGPRTTSVPRVPPLWSS